MQGWLVLGRSQNVSTFWAGILALFRCIHTLSTTAGSQFVIVERTNEARRKVNRSSARDGKAISHPLSKYNYRQGTIFRQSCGYRNAEDTNGFISSARSGGKDGKHLYIKAMLEGMSQSCEWSHNRDQEGTEMRSQPGHLLPGGLSLQDGDFQKTGESRAFWDVKTARKYNTQSKEGGMGLKSRKSCSGTARAAEN